MNAPGGGECGGVNDKAGNSLEKAISSSRANSRAAGIEAEPGRLGATTTAGSGALVMQQSLRKDG